MRRLIKHGLYSAGYYGRRLRQVAFPGVAVLCYHGVRAAGLAAEEMAIAALHVPADELDEHCRLLRETCHPIGLADWRNALAGGPPLPERPVLVTFDDGYRSVYTEALPILARHAIPAAVFVCSDPIERPGPFWFDAVARLCGEDEVERLKGLPFDDWRRATAELPAPTTGDDPNAALSVSELCALAAAPGIEIGGHTASHPILARAGIEQQRDEIGRNKRRLEEWVDRPVTAFAYPNGRPREDFTVETLRLVASLGYGMAFTSHYGFAAPAEPLLELSRFLMLAGISGAELAHRLSYSWLSPAPASAS